ncbi:hypothetical protein BaRGS_00025302 [Batillaria attramentaria]|uniref:Uncharacterized protein n=1 Tax=Batillaria attramentaria TaxID=370345 RepID=A0ABD0K8V7_9CAEN
MAVRVGTDSNGYAALANNRIFNFQGNWSHTHTLVAELNSPSSSFFCISFSQVKAALLSYKSLHELSCFDTAVTSPKVPKIGACQELQLLAPGLFPPSSDQDLSVGHLSASLIWYSQSPSL